MWVVTFASKTKDDDSTSPPEKRSRSSSADDESKKYVSIRLEQRSSCEPRYYKVSLWLENKNSSRLHIRGESRDVADYEIAEKLSVAEMIAKLEEGLPRYFEDYTTIKETRKIAEKETFVCLVSV